MGIKLKSFNLNDRVIHKPTKEIGTVIGIYSENVCQVLFDINKKDEPVLMWNFDLNLFQDPNELLKKLV